MQFATCCHPLISKSVTLLRCESLIDHRHSTMVSYFQKAVVASGERVSMAGNYKPSFAQRVRGNTAVNLKRPTCLNFKTKTNLRRVEILQMLSEIRFKTENLFGVAEMKNRSIDITCKTRENDLELYAKLKDIESITTCCFMNQ